MNESQTAKVPSGQFLRKTKNYLAALFMLIGANSSAQCDGLEVEFDYEIDGGTIYFENTTSGEGFGTTYSWTYGSETSTDENPMMDAEYGTIEACLTVTTTVDSAGTVCTGTYCDSIYWDGDTTSVEGPCDDVEANFIYYTDGTNIYFLNNSTPDGGTIFYEWEIFGDTYTDENPIVPVGSEDSEDICLFIQVWMEDSVVCEDEYCEPYVEADSSVLSVSALETVEVKLFPNPVENELNVSLSSADFDQIAIYNAMGQLVLRQDYIGNARNRQVSTEDLEPGVYIIKIADSAHPERIVTEFFAKK